jgi:hypothetical protein
MRIPHALAVGAAIAPLVLHAQAQPITIRFAPAANQTFHMRVVQETSMDVAPGERAGDAGLQIPAMKLGLTMTMLSTTVVGVADADGRIEARMTYDDARMDMTMNGQPSPMPNTLAQLAGRVFTLVYGADGRMLDMKGDVPGVALGALKSVMSGAFGATEPLTLAIGDTVTRPISIPLPIPNAGAGGISAQMRFTLNGVGADGADRIAHLGTALTGRMTPPAPATGGGVAAAIEMLIDGTGSMDVNLERGFVSKSEQQMTIDGTIGGSPPAMRMHGTLKLSQATEP